MDPADAPPLPVIAYARISDDGESDAHGVKDQHRVNRATAKRLGWTVVCELTDNDRSASKADVVRESFELMLIAIRAGHLADGTTVQGVVILNEDRLARRAGDYERFVEALTCQEGRVYADERGPRDLYSEDVEGLGLVGVAFSKIESRKVRRRLRRWHQARAEDGKPPGGTRPFGWRATDRLLRDPVEAQLLATAAGDFIAGRSLTSIVREWQRQGLRTSLGNGWSPRTLKLALDNPRICGWRRLRGDIVRDGAGAPVVGLWEPIVSPDVWLAVHALMESRRGMRVTPAGIQGPLPGDFREHRYLLTGTLRCGRTRADGSLCGARLRVVHQRDCVQHIYACPPKANGGCAGVGRRGDLVDAYVSEAVLAKLDERRAVQQRDEVPWAGHVEIGQLEAKLGTLRHQWTSSEISDSLFFATARDLEGRLRLLRNEQGSRLAATLRSRDRFNDVRDRWYGGGLDLSQRRAYVQEALLAVIVRPAGRGRRAFDPNLLELVWRS